jgi:hypothetical protein
MAASRRWRGAHDTAAMSAEAGEKMLGESLHLRVADDVGRGGNVVGEKPIGRGEGHLGAQGIVGLLQ